MLRAPVLSEKSGRHMADIGDACVACPASKCEEKAGRLTFTVIAEPTAFGRTRNGDVAKLAKKIRYRVSDATINGNR